MTRRLILPVLALAAGASGAANAATEVRGRVVSGGRPVAATVAARAAETAWEAARREALGQPPPPPFANAVAGADGAFVLTLPEASASYEVRVGAPGFVSVHVAVAAAGGRADLGEVGLVPSAALQGRVVDAAGRNVARARVVGEPGRPAFAGGLAEPEPVETTTGPDGTFRLDGLAATGNRLRVEAPGFASARFRGQRAGTLGTPLVLAPAAPVAGRVLGVDGRTPVAGALVSVRSGEARSRPALTDADGRFRVGDAGAGASSVTAEAGARGRAEVSLRGRAAGGPLTLVLAPAAALAGRVVDAASGAPVAGALVTVRGASGGEATRSGGDGRYRLEGLAPGAYEVRVDEPRRVPYVRDEVTVAAGRTTPLDLPLRLAASLSGRVVDETGRPVAGALGRLVRSGSSRFDLRRSLGLGSEPDFRSAADGTFEVARTAPGDNQQLVVTHPDYERRAVPGLDLKPGRPLPRLTVVMSRGLEIRGLVLDQDARPVEGAEVEARPSASERMGPRGMVFLEMAPGRRGGDHALPRSGPDGRFRVAGLAAGAHALRVRREGYAEGGLDPVRLEHGEAAPEVELRLLPGAAIRGHVRRGDGSAARGHIVRARPENGGDPGGFGPLGLGPLEPTGDDGAFAVDGLRAGETYTLQVLGPPGPGGSPRVGGVRAPAEDVELLVPGAGRVAGRVVDAQTKEPLPEFTAHWEPDQMQGAFMRIARAPRRLARRLGGEADDEGAFRSPDGSFLLEDVPAGTVSVVVEAPGYEAARVSGIVVREGETAAEVEVRATKGRAVRGRVFDSVSGRPVVGATVAASEADRPRMPIPVEFQDGATFTDADGRFELRGLGLGTWTLRVRHPEYSEASRLVDLQSPAAEVEIRLSSGSSLGGVVVSEGGAPVAGAAVELDEGGAGGPGLRFGPGGFGGSGTLSDDAGRFRFDRLAAGRYSLTASLRGRSSTPLEVPLQSGETRHDLRVRLDAGATVRGRVVGLDAGELSSTNVSATGPQGFFTNARPAPDGSFTLGGVPAGTLDLRAMAGDFATRMRSAAAQVEVLEGQAEAEAEIVFEAQGAISGRVTRGGEALPEVMLSVSGAGVPGAFARTDGAGGYRLEGLRDGSYTVTASPPSGASHKKTVQVAGEATLDFDLPLARIAGVVVEAGTGLPLQEAEVEVDTEDGAGGSAFGRGQPRARTDSHGRFALEGLPPGAATLTARRTGYVYERRAVTAREDGGSETTLELRRGEGLGLLARDARHGFPLRSLFVEVRDASGAAAFAGPLSLDSDGRGEIPSLRPGAYALKLRAPGYATSSFRIAVPSPTLEVALGEGGTLEIRSGPATVAAQPRARLLDATGAPVAEPPVGPEGTFVLTGAVRRFEHLPPGRYSVVVEGGPSKETSVAEGALAVVDLP